MAYKNTVIVYARRTPIGNIMGGLASLAAPRLGAALVADALNQLSLDRSKVDEIIMGNVLTAGVGQAPARQTAIYGGLPPSVCATTIGRVCGSGIKAVMLADQAIRLGDAKMVFAGGQESMSMAPHVLLGSRDGFRFGDVTVKDSMQFDGLWDPYSNVPMGNCAEICVDRYKFSREAQDEFAVQSYRKARRAIESGDFAAEIVPIEVKNRKGAVQVAVDEEPFSVDLDRLATLKPAFNKEGSVTAGNASSINDGAALLVMMAEDEAKSLGIRPLARIVSQASYAHEPEMFTTAPIGCIKNLLQKSHLKASDIDLFEINEAFAAVTMAAIHDLNLDPQKVNIHGGAVALGHPIGASGARILVTLLHALTKYKLRRGLATLCIGGGEASGVVVEMI